MAKNKGDKLEGFKSSAEKVWLAGLGALAQAEKQGDKLFKSLVKKGEKYDELIPSASDAVKGSISSARKQASSTFKELESAIDHRVQAGIKRAGLARQSELDALKKEVKQLKKASGSPGAKKKTKKKTKKKATKKKATKKKKTTRKKPAATRRRKTSTGR